MIATISRPCGAFALAWLICLAATPLQTTASTVDLTRYLAQHPACEGAPASYEESFFGVPGGARLIVTGNEGLPAIELNGSPVAYPAGMRGEVTITLTETNSIRVTLTDSSTCPATIRVKQAADIELHVQSRVHFNTNVSDFAAARDFYGKLGFETLSGFPDTNTLEMAQAIGIETPTSYDGSQGEAAGGYLLHGELVGLGFFDGVIDLIEFTIPRNDDPPYAQLNHLGMARAAMHTTNITADYEYMKKEGVKFITAPTTRSDGSTFAIFTDLDGTYYELIEVEGEDEETETTHIVRLGHVNINVSDFERSMAWYQMLGFELTNKLPNTDSLAVANAMGFDEEFEIDGAMVTHPIDGSTLELVQWITPRNPEKPYPIPINHLGIHRMAFATSDIEADVATLKAQGVEFISEITPCCSGPDSWGGIVAFYDPDGTIIELVEQPFMSELMSVARWLRDLFR